MTERRFARSSLSPFGPNEKDAPERNPDYIPPCIRLRLEQKEENKTTADEEIIKRGLDEMRNVVEWARKEKREIDADEAKARADWEAFVKFGNNTPFETHKRTVETIASIPDYVLTFDYARAVLEEEKKNGRRPEYLLWSVEGIRAAESKRKGKRE